MSQLGRISGPLLKANLIRDGVDLAFETDLLYLDVNNSRIGIRTTSPQYDLDVNGTVRSTDLLITNQATIAAISISGNDIVSSTGIIDFTASGGDATVYHSRLIIDDYQIQGNVIATTVSNSSIELRTNGTGTIELQADTNITGDLYVSGNISADGDIIVGGNVVIGDQITDTITVNARIASNLIPLTDITFDIGSPSQRWRDIYANRIFASTEFTLGDFVISGNTITTSANSIIFDTPAGQSVIFNSTLLIDDISIAGNKISTVVSNSALEFEASGAGTIEILSNTEITGNVAITGDLDVTGNITIGGNIIIGDESTDTITINASIQSDLIPELDDTYDLGTPSFRWKDIYVNNFFTTALRVPTLDIGDLEFRNNEIISTSNTDIIVNGSGTGGVRFGNFRFSGNTITNTVSGAITAIAQTGTGYFKINTTNGFVPPVGNNAQRPTAYAVLGMTRYNTVSKALEVWDGITWASPAGALGAVSVTAAEDIAAIYALTLG